MAQPARAATLAVYDLAEGVIWDDRASLVRWVDIWKGRVLAGRLDGETIVDITEVELGQTAAAIALADDGGLLIAAARGLATISPDGVVSFGPDLLGDRGNVRLNDGTVDPQGRFVVGSLSLTDDTGTEALLRVSQDGGVETLRSGVRLSNGVAFSPDGRLIYHVDTFARTVSRHPYDAEVFNAWETIIRFDRYPDGLTVDADGDLWIAEYDGGRVVHADAEGRRIDVVTIDAAQATCPAFVGPELGILAITSAQEGLDDWSDQSGALFLADVGATGLPVTHWPGSTTTPYWPVPVEQREET